MKEAREGSWKDVLSMEDDDIVEKSVSFTYDSPTNQ